MQQITFLNKLNETFELVENARQTEYGAWKTLAVYTVKGDDQEEGFGANFIHFMMLTKKDGRKQTAVRSTSHLKTVDPEGYKAAKETAKMIRDQMKERALARGLANDRKLIADFIGYCVESAGLTNKYPEPVKSNSSSQKAHIEFIGEAVRMLINHLNETEDSQCLDLKELFPKIVEAAENDGVIKID
jgi:hypothetical protein